MERRHTPKVEWTLLVLTISNQWDYLYVGQKERGWKKDGSKHVYGIKQNEARETYLGHYYGLDNADHMIKNMGNRYITWEYWHICTFMHSHMESWLHMTCTLNAVRAILMKHGWLTWRIGWRSPNSISGCLRKCYATTRLIICTLVIRHFKLALGLTRLEGNLMRIKVMQDSGLAHQQKEQQWSNIEHLWLQADCAQH
jgi:hypothetical protein